MVWASVQEFLPKC
jgi:sulfiredoxin